MTPLSRNEKERIFDYCLGLIRTEQAVAIEALLGRNEGAADVHARIQAVLVPLESFHPELCPTELAERTIRLLCAAAQEARVAARMKTMDPSQQGLEDRGRCCGEFNAYSLDEVAIMEFWPESRN